MGTSVGNPKEPCPLASEKDPLKSKTDEVTLKCEHRSLPKGKNYFEVVPKVANVFQAYKDKLTLQWIGPNKPITLKVSGIGEVPQTAGNFEIELSSNFFDEKWQTYKKNVDDSTSLKTKALFVSLDVIRQCWTIEHKKQFLINGLPNGSMPVTFFNPEMWKLSVTFPSFKPYKNGKKYEGKTIMALNAVKPILVNGVAPAPEPEYKNTVSLTRSGNTLQLSGLDIIHNFLRIVKIYTIIQEYLKKTPKIGWYLDWELQICQGKIELEWGWEEFSKQDVPNKDAIDTNEAVYKVKLLAEAKIVEVKVEFGFGVSSFGFGAQIFIGINGEVKLSASLTKIAPVKNLDAELQAKFEGTIKGIGGARVELGYMYKIEFTLESAFKIEGSVRISKSSGFVVLATVGWTGVTGKVTQSSDIGSTFGSVAKSTKYSTKNGEVDLNNGEHVFIKPMEFGKYEFPSSTKPSDYIMSDDDVKAVIKSMLEGDIIKGGRVDKQNPKGELMFTWENKSGVYTFDYEYVQLQLITDEIFVMIKINKKIRPDRKTIEGLAIWIRMELELLIKESLLHFDYILHTDFTIFMLTRLKPFLINLEDPTYTK